MSEENDGVILTLLTHYRRCAYLPEESVIPK